MAQDHFQTPPHLKKGYENHKENDGNLRSDQGQITWCYVNKDYPMEPDEFEILYKHNCYCHMAHISQYGYPIVTPMFYVVLEDGHIYISSVNKYRKKIEHLIANPKISVSISNDGSNAKRQKSIQIIELTRSPNTC